MSGTRSAARRRGAPAAFDAARARRAIAEAWERSIVPALCEYVRIPCRSPHFDPEWARAGHLERAVALAEAWCRAQPVAGLRAEVVRLPARTPVLLLEVPGGGDGRALVYGHLDKQPELEGWEAGLGPWTPVRRGDRLYGRGAADDGYAVFAAVGALAALHAQRVRHARCTVLIETGEESGSPDLPTYLEHLAGRIDAPDLVVCLDSGCGSYDTLWCTTSLRGLVGGVLSVRVLEEGVHSGDASGIVPSSFRIARQLLSRLEDEASGAIRIAEAHAPIPEQRAAEAAGAARALGASFAARFPFAAGARALTDDPVEGVLNRTWRPFLEVTGAEGLPPPARAGNVLRPETALKLSLRLPPSADPALVARRLRERLEADPPHGARVRFEPEWSARGWNAPPLEPWLAGSLARASRAWFGRDALFMGEGGTIPFVAMLAERFPRAQFLVTGVLGPGANAHGPNEFLHLPTAQRLTGCLAQVLADHVEERSG